MWAPRHINSKRPLHRGNRPGLTQLCRVRSHPGKPQVCNLGALMGEGNARELQYQDVWFSHEPTWVETATESKEKAKQLLVPSRKEVLIHFPEGKHGWFWWNWGRGSIWSWIRECRSIQDVIQRVIIGTPYIIYKRHLTSNESSDGIKLLDKASKMAQLIKHL